MLKTFSNKTISPKAFGYDSDAQAYMNACQDPFTFSQKNAIENGFIALKAGNNNFSLIERCYLFSNAGRPNSLVSLKNPTGTKAAEVASPALTWTSAGFTSDGSTSYINTNFNPRIDSITITKNSVCVFWYCNTDVQDSKVDWGCYDGTNATNNYVNTRFTDDHLYAGIFSGDEPDFGSNTDSRGFYALEVIGTTASVYKNGVLFGTHSLSIGTQMPNLNFYVCGFNFEDASVQSLTTRQQSLWGIAASGINHSELYNAFLLML